MNPRTVSPRLFGLMAALVALAADQANKLWLIYVFGIAERQPVRVTSFFDIVYARNPGISYSLLSARTDLGRWALLAVTVAATILIAIWLWRAKTKLVALGLGLIVGGALGNACDRLFFGTVADFYHFHAGSFSWYIFNLADCAIVAGVGLLLYDSLMLGQGQPPEKSPEVQTATKSPRSEA